MAGETASSVQLTRSAKKRKSDGDGVIVGEGAEGGGAASSGGATNDTVVVGLPSNLGLLTAAMGDTKLFDLPSTLQRQLVDDWEFVTKEQKLVPLPREPNVSGVLSTWLHTKSRRGIADQTSREIADGLRDFFDEALGTMLLYKFERLQYNKVMQNGGDPETKPSRTYGAEHLLRLLIKLPTLLDNANVEPPRVAMIAEKVNDLATFLHRNGRVVFLPDYEPAGESYCGEAYSH